MPRFALRLAAVAAVCLGGCNPFAPDLGDEAALLGEGGNPRTVDGFFTRFRVAYELRDLSLYEPLLDSSFAFVYYDYDAQVERGWGFAQELEGTRRLFASSSNVSLRWGSELIRNETPTEARVTRRFELAVRLADDASELRTDGNVAFTLVRRDTAQAWRLVRWRDESVQ
ncbi:MAG: hypothetical protein LCH53_08965 [Bacteroidetes bacterium]|nr:hypothetical protein [Bacteroidota bacterium]